MASLGKFMHRERNADTNEYLDFTGAVTVSKDGIFRITVDNPELAQVIIANHSNKVYLNEGPKYLGICGYDLDAIKQDIITGMKRFLQPQKTVEYVIRYIVASNWTAWVNHETGEFWGSGGAPGCAPRPPAGWDGQGGLHANKTVEAFSFAVGAQVYRKTTYSRGAHVRHEYGRANQDDAAHIGQYGQELATYSCWPDRHDSKAVEVPYTEERAKFFLELVKAIVKLGMMTKPYLKDPQAVEAAIEQYAAGQLRLPGGR